MWDVSFIFVKIKLYNMKLSLFTLLSVLTLNMFSQLLPTFNLYVVNPDICQYTLTGSYIAYTNGGEVVGNIEFSPAGALDTYMGYLPSADSIHYVICGDMIPPCSGQNCIEGMFYLGPDGSFGSITMLIMNTMLDMDGDGYPSSMDCDDTNPWVYPGAFEECNGIDNNCDGVNDIVPSVNMYFVPDSLVNEDYTIYVVSQTTDVVSWVWQFGSATVIDNPYPTNYYASEGTFEFCLNALSMDGCSTDTCMTFTIDSMGWNSSGFMTSYTLNIVPEYNTSSVTELSNEINICPNPVVDVLNVSTSGNNGLIEIYSFDGKMVYNTNYYSNMTKVDVTQMNSGGYLVVVKDNDGGISTTKFIK